MAGTDAENKGPSSSSSAGRLHSTEVLNQRKKLPVCPMRMALVGFAATVVIGYTVLYSKKKPEASAMDVAKVTTGMARPEDTHPPK
ncbi:hypothetical protein K1719_011547 [Acacia pycnantha]|nr:hypothetical protein K1719_011547 [Acacia pycnantha]